MPSLNRLTDGSPTAKQLCSREPDASMQTAPKTMELSVSTNIYSYIFVGVLVLMEVSTFPTNLLKCASTILTFNYYISITFMKFDIY